MAPHKVPSLRTPSQRQVPLVGNRSKAPDKNPSKIIEENIAKYAVDANLFRLGSTNPKKKIPSAGVWWRAKPLHQKNIYFLNFFFQECIQTIFFQKVSNLHERSGGIS